MLFLVFNINAKAELPAETLRNPVISGYVKDAETGELLIGATVFIKGTQKGTTSNLYGFYSLQVPAGKVTIACTYVGYVTYEQTIDVKTDATLNLMIQPEAMQLNEVQIVAERKEAHVEAPQMGVEKLQAKTIKEIPALLGEVDAIKVLQMLPGVQPAAEGSSGFSVRGGNPDQNLILLDEAIVYNAGHMLGFFSVFNNDAIKDVKLFKGDIPARSGGRLASLVDIRMKDGNAKKISGSGGIGTISSRLTLEGPIIKDKTTFVVSGRRTYADLFLPLASDKSIRKNKLYFYDLNAKVTHTFNDNNRLFVSGYFGRDVFSESTTKMEFGNKTLTARYNHIFSPRLFSNFTFIYSNYNYFLGSEDDGQSSFEWKSSLTDYSVKADFNYYANENNNITFGYQSIYHNIAPCDAGATEENSDYNRIVVPNDYSLEHAIYVENTQKISPRLNVRYGLRLSAFQNMGKDTLYHYNELYEEDGSKAYGKGDIYHTYWNIEPRLGLTFLIDKDNSVKASYSRTSQYQHLATNSTATTPLDIWFASSPNIKPQICDQISAGYFRNLWDNKVELSVETFYKEMQNAIDFKDYPQLLFNKKLDGELRFGKAHAYGAELMARFNTPKWNGWISYTWSKSERKINGINDNNWYQSPYDHTNDCSVIVNYKTSKRVTLAANWVYLTGAPFTAPIGRFESGGNVLPLYSKRNAERMPDYHRLDLSCTLANKEKPGRKWQGEWVFSIYNAYSRHNAWAINFVQDEDNPSVTKAEKTYLFSMIPSVTYNFKF
jgi:hypothetical protein